MGASDHHLLKGAESNSPLSHPILFALHSCFTEEIPKILFIKIKLKLVQRQTKAVNILHLPDHFWVNRAQAFQTWVWANPGRSNRWCHRCVFISGCSLLIKWLLQKRGLRYTFLLFTKRFFLKYVLKNAHKFCAKPPPPRFWDKLCLELGDVLWIYLKMWIINPATRKPKYNLYKNRYDYRCRREEF